MPELKTKKLKNLEKQSVGNSKLSTKEKLTRKQIVLWCELRIKENGIDNGFYREIINKFSGDF